MGNEIKIFVAADPCKDCRDFAKLSGIKVTDDELVYGGYDLVGSVGTGKTLYILHPYKNKKRLAEISENAKIAGFEIVNMWKPWAEQDVYEYLTDWPLNSENITLQLTPLLKSAQSK